MNILRLLRLSLCKAEASFSSLMTVLSLLFHIHVLKKKLIYLFIFGCIGSSLLYAGFSSCGKQGLLFIVVRGLLIVVASLGAEHGL